MGEDDEQDKSFDVIYKGGKIYIYIFFQIYILVFINIV